MIPLDHQLMLLCFYSQYVSEIIGLIFASLNACELLYIRCVTLISTFPWKMEEVAMHNL